MNTTALIQGLDRLEKIIRSGHAEFLVAPKSNRLILLDGQSVWQGNNLENLIRSMGTGYCDEKEEKVKDPREEDLRRVMDDLRRKSTSLTIQDHWRVEDLLDSVIESFQEAGAIMLLVRLTKEEQEKALQYAMTSCIVNVLPGDMRPPHLREARRSVKENKPVEALALMLWYLKNNPVPAA